LEVKFNPLSAGVFLKIRVYFTKMTQELDRFGLWNRAVV